jgi:hypothetical protein
VLDDLDIQGKMNCELINAKFDIVDECAVQYQCATVLYILGQLAIQLNVCYTRNVQAPSHGKEEGDGIIGGEKTYLDKILRVLAFMQKKMIMLPKHQCIAWIAME